MSQYKPLPPLEELREVFSVTPVKRLGHDSGLVYKVDYKKNKKGQVAGRLYVKEFKQKRKRTIRYDWIVYFKGYNYIVSRIVYYLIHSIDPGDLVVDHKDGEPRNNNISNLEVATHAVNSLRRTKEAWSDTGVTGLYISSKERNLWYTVFKIGEKSFRTPITTCSRISCHLYNLSVLKHAPHAADRKVHNLSDIACMCGSCPLGGEPIQRSFMEGDCVDLLRATECMCNVCDSRYTHHKWYYWLKIRETKKMLKDLRG